MTSDLDLLRQFARENSQDAFAGIVRRHLALVYSAALRQVRSPQLAEDISQSVFADLAHDAGKLKPDTILTAWLYAVTRRTAIDAIRKESRRQLREQIAVEMNTMNATANDWTQIEPLLDDAMAALDETDRSAILLRYFENKNLREVGETLGTSEDAAQKRVSRAVERLREFFSKRNMTVGASGLAVLISANAIQAAPVGLATTISTAAVLAGTAVSTSTVIAATKTIAMTTIQKTFIATTLAVVAGTGIYEAHQVSSLRSQNELLQQQQAPLAEQIRQLQHERDDATNRLVALSNDNERLNRNTLELLKLRNEVTQLHRESKELAQLKSNSSTKDEVELADKSWLDRVRLLKQRLDQSPEAKIPELQFLTEDDWLSAAKHKLDTDNDYRGAFAELRGSGEATFLRSAQEAVMNYMGTNNGVFPTDLAQLKRYFKNSPSDEILQRYEIVPASNLPQATISGNAGDWLITLKSPDSPGLMTLGQNGVAFSSPDDSGILAILAPAMKALFDAAPSVNGRKSVSIRQLAPFLTTPEQKAAYQKLMQNINPASK